MSLHKGLLGLTFIHFNSSTTMWFNILYHLEWTSGHTRTAFPTHLDNVTVMRFTANVSPAISFNTPFVTPMDNPVYAVTSVRLTMTARGPRSYPGLWLVSVLNVQPSNNTVSTLADQAVIVTTIDPTTTDITVSRETRDKVGVSLSATSWKQTAPYLIGWVSL
ncbi:hypothetical protein F5146DRAFT_999811 [Armillaria mellea]|nr:hypothetical protein F5146DRAFT_999811 [Armillaria mellea]